MANVDDNFYDRADEHINLSNKQHGKTTRGKVSASMMYATARYNAWISASGFENGKDMSEAMEETLQYFLVEYEKMLKENLKDYIDNFDQYMKPTQ